ncbi:MAG: hypothetical protein ACO4CT_07760 [Planctomycetota bacterium]|jgi:hypothetical protein
MKLALASLAAAAALAAVGSSQSTIEDSFTYADGDLSSVGTGGVGWDPSGWQIGNSNVNTRFAVINGQCMYQGGGTSAATWQPRSFVAPLSTSVGLTIVLRYTLIRAETQPGRGIGIELTLGGVRQQLMIGKEINGPVGLHEKYYNGPTYAQFATSGAVEPITATFTYDGTNTSIVLSDSNEVLPAHTVAGVLTFDGVELFGYHGQTVGNGIDDLRIDVTASSATNYGVGCDGLTLGATDLPRIGNGTFGLRVSNIAFTAGAAFVGIGAIVIDPGIDLTYAGMPGCYNASSLDLGAFPAGPATTGEATMPLPIPNDPSISGAVLATQGFALSLATPLGLASSNGVRLQIDF